MSKNMEKEASEIKTVIDNIEGWLTYPEGKLLYALAKKCTGKGAIVEIGSWKGKSTICLGKGSKAGSSAKIYAIDPHIGSQEHQEKHGKVWTFEEFKNNIKAAGVEDAIKPIVKTSEDAAKDFNEPVELLFIDGAHEYEPVKLDYELWAPKVIEGGIIAFHDTIKWPGPAKVVKDNLFLSKNFRNVRVVDAITYGQKVSKNSPKDRLMNRHRLLLKTIYERADKLKLPRPVKRAGKKLMGLLQS